MAKYLFIQLNYSYGFMSSLLLFTYNKRLFVVARAWSGSDEDSVSDILKESFDGTSLEERFIDRVIHEVVSDISSMGSRIDGTFRA